MYNSKMAKGVVLGVLLGTLLFPSFVFSAQDPPCPEAAEGKLCNPINVDSLPAFVHKLLVGIIKIGLPIIALALVYVGFLFVAARGNPEKLGKAKQALLYTIIGAAILLGSWAIAKLISETVLSLD